MTSNIGSLSDNSDDLPLGSQGAIVELIRKSADCFEDIMDVASRNEAMELGKSYLRMALKFLKVSEALINKSKLFAIIIELDGIGFNYLK